LELELIYLMQMRGFGVVWSPDSPSNEAMKIWTEPGNPRGKKNQMIASGKPLL